MDHENNPGNEGWEEALEGAMADDNMEEFGKMAGDLMHWEPVTTMEELLANAEGFSDEFFTAWANSIRQNKDLLKMDPEHIEAITNILCDYIQKEHRWKILHKLVILVDGFAGLATMVCLEYLHTSRDSSQTMQQASEHLLKAMHPSGKTDDWAVGFVDLWQQSVAENHQRKKWETHVEESHFLNQFERVLSLLYRERSRLWSPSEELLDKLVRAFSFHANYLQMSRGNIRNLQGITAAMLDALHCHRNKLGADVTKEIAKRRDWNLLTAISLRNGEEFVENLLEPTELESFRLHSV